MGQRERKRSHQRVKSLARNHQSQESRVNVTWAHQNLLSQTPRSTLALENVLVGGTSRGRTARAATRAAGSVSRTRSLDQTPRREAAAKQGRTRSTARPSKKKANVGKFGQYWQCECNKGYTGNGIQCMDGDGNLSAQPGQQVEVTLTMTAGLYEDAPVENELSHGDAMESLLAEMETAGGPCAGDDCEATFEVTEV